MIFPSPLRSMDFIVYSAEFLWRKSLQIIWPQETNMAFRRLFSLMIVQYDQTSDFLSVKLFCFGISNHYSTSSYDDNLLYISWGELFTIMLDNITKSESLPHLENFDLSCTEIKRQTKVERRKRLRLQKLVVSFSAIPSYTQFFFVFACLLLYFVML